jgi:hypothetical protein
MIFTPSIVVDVLLLMIAGIMVGHGLTLKLRRRFFVFDPLNMFWAGAIILYLYQPIAFFDYFVAWYGQDVLEETLLWVLLGLSFVVIGYEGRWGVRWGKMVPALPQHLSRQGLFGAALSLIALGLGGYSVEFASAGGIERWASVARGGTDWDKVSGYSAILTSLLPAGVGLLVLHVEMHRATPLRRSLAWLVFALMLLWFFYLGTRNGTIVMVMTALMAYYLPRRKNPRPLLLAVIFLALFATSNFLAKYRQNFFNLSFNFEKIDWDEAIAQSLPGILPGTQVRNKAFVSKGIEFSCTMAAVKLVPNVIPFNYGYSELEFLTRIVPRGIWPEKRYPEYEAFTPIYQMEDLSRYWIPYATTPILAGPAFGYIGHWYAVGGAIALVFAGLFTGGLFRAIRAIFNRPEKREGDLVLYMLVIIPIGFGDAASTPLFWIFTLPLILMPVLVLLYLTRRRDRKLREVQRTRALLRS